MFRTREKVWFPSGFVNRKKYCQIYSENQHNVHEKGGLAAEKYDIYDYCIEIGASEGGFVCLIH
jgi:hypothetical protein